MRQGAAGGRRAESHEVPGGPPGVTGRVLLGRPMAPRGSTVGVVWGTWGPASFHRGVSTGAPVDQPGVTSGGPPGCPVVCRGCWVASARVPRGPPGVAEVGPPMQPRAHWVTTDTVRWGARGHTRSPGVVRRGTWRPAGGHREGSARAPGGRVRPLGCPGACQGSQGWVLRCTQDPAGGHRGGSSGTPGGPMGVTWVGPRGCPGSCWD